MGLKVTNNAFGTLNAGITSSATTIVLTAGQGARFPTLSAGDYFYATLIDTSNNLEIVKVTARSTDTMTVVRGQDNTTARAYSTNDRFELRPTAALFNELATDIATKVSKTGDTLSGGLTFSNTDATGVPVGTTAQRPGTPVSGQVRCNSSNNVFEFYNGTGWQTLVPGNTKFEDAYATLITSTTNTTFRNMRTFVYDYAAGDPKVMSIGISAWITSGAYYWTWRLYNSTKSAAIPLISGGNRPEEYISTGGGIGFIGGVHNQSAQMWANFDMSSCDNGDTIALQMSPHTSGSGSVAGLIASTQQLNLQGFKAAYGLVTGLSGTAYWGI